MTGRTSPRRRLLAAQHTLFARALDGVQQGDDKLVGESLTKLAQVRALIEMDGAISLWRRRLIPLALLAIVTVGVLLATSLRVGSARIDMQAVTSRVRVQSATEQFATRPLRMAAVAFTGARHISAPADMRVPANGLSLSLSGADQPITLEPVRLEPGDWIAIATEELAGEYRLVITPRDNTRAIRLAFSVHGALKAAAGGAPDSEVSLTFPVPRQVEATWTPGTPAVMTFSTDEQELSAGVNIQAIDLDRMTFIGDVQTPESALAGAKVAFPDYSRAIVELPDGERIRTERLIGRARRIVVVPNKNLLSVNVQGEAVALEVASGGDWRSVLPTWLDYAKDRNELTTLWASAATGFALLLAWIRWWKEPPK